MMIYCHICYNETDKDFICDTCDNYYCEDCSYTYSLHYQYEGLQCYFCSNQNRRSKLSKEMIRNNKILLILN